MIWVVVWPDLDDEDFSQAFGCETLTEALAVERAHLKCGSYVEVWKKETRGRLGHTPRDRAAFRRVAAERERRASALRDAPMWRLNLDERRYV